MKKISSNFYKEEAQPKTRSISVPFEGEMYEIIIRDDLTLKEKAELFKDMLVIINEKRDESNDPAFQTVAMTMCLIKALTDIDFPDTVDGQFDQFYALMDKGFVEKVFESLREGLADELMLFIKEAAENLAKEDPATLVSQFDNQ